MQILACKICQKLLLMLMNQNFFFYLCINLGRTDTILGWNQYFVKHVKESEDAPHDKYIEPRDVHI